MAGLNGHSRGYGISLALGLLAVANPGGAQDRGLNEINFRAIGLLPTSGPIDRLSGGGITLQRQLDDRWFIGIGIDTYRVEITDPRKLVVGLEPASPSPGIRSSTLLLSTLLGQRQRMGGTRWSSLWSLGVGVGFPQGSNSQGVTVNGDPYELALEAGAEIHALGALGAQYRVSADLSFELTARFEHHFSSIRSVERVSGRTSQWPSNAVVGIHVGLNYRF